MLFTVSSATGEFATSSNLADSTSTLIDRIRKRGNLSQLNEPSRKRSQYKGKEEQDIQFLNIVLNQVENTRGL
jgi:hypothetical protein